MGTVTGRVTCKMAHLEARDCQVEGLPELWPIFFLLFSFPSHTPIAP